MRNEDVRCFVNRIYKEVSDASYILNSILISFFDNFNEENESDKEDILISFAEKGAFCRAVARNLDEIYGLIGLFKQAIELEQKHGEQ